MSDYVKATNFTTKDGLSPGNPLKRVQGTEIDTEFNAIAVAIATKADRASPNLTGTPTAPTAAYGTSNTQLATTAFVQAALQALYPVGTIYTSVSPTNPGTIFGFGTWTAFGAGRVLVGVDSGDTLFDTVEETGGSKNTVLPQHNHTASTNTVADHTHGYYIYNGAGGLSYVATPETSSYASTHVTTPAGAHNHTVTVDNAGSGSGTNTNLQPYITVYMWKRII